MFCVHPHYTFCIRNVHILVWGMKWLHDYLLSLVPRPLSTTIACESWCLTFHPFWIREFGNLSRPRAIFTFLPSTLVYGPTSCTWHWIPGSPSFLVYVEKRSGSLGTRLYLLSLLLCFIQMVGFPTLKPKVPPSSFADSAIYFVYFSHPNGIRSPTKNHDSVWITAVMIAVSC